MFNRGVCDPQGVLGATAGESPSFCLLFINSLFILKIETCLKTHMNVDIISEDNDSPCKYLS